jgi:hypothetical protein
MSTRWTVYSHDVKEVPLNEIGCNEFTSKLASCMDISQDGLFLAFADHNGLNIQVFSISAFPALVLVLKPSDSLSANHDDSTMVWRSKSINISSNNAHILSIYCAADTAFSNSQQMMSEVCVWSTKSGNIIASQR